MFATLPTLILVLASLTGAAAQSFEPEQVYCCTARECRMGARTLLSAENHPDSHQPTPILPDVRIFSTTMIFGKRSKFLPLSHSFFS